MENKENPKEKEGNSRSAQSMPSRRAFRHVERIRIVQEEIEKKELTQETDDVPLEIIDTAESKPVTEEKKALFKFPWKKPDKKTVLKVVFGVIALLIVAAVVTGIIVFAQKEKKGGYSRNFMDQLRTQEFHMAENEPVNGFFRQYYDALSAGDTTVMEGLFDNPAKADVSAGVSTIVESYENLAVYMTDGLENNEYVAFVYNDVKFNNINTLAPSVDCYYLVMDGDGEYKICWDMYQNEDKIRFSRLASYMMPIRQLLADSDAALQNALNQDKDLKNLYIVMQSMTDAVLEQDAAENSN